MISTGKVRRPDARPRSQRTEIELGRLVQFEKREKGRGPGKPQGAADADILIFTGVRYERATPVAEPTKPSDSTKPKRKRG